MTARLTSAAFELDALESRRFLNGVTVITHGYEATSSNSPGWLNYMAGAISASAGPDTAVYYLKITHNGNSAQVTTFSRLLGPDPTSDNSTDGESVLMVDWADVSGIGLTTPTWTTAQIAGLVEPYLTGVFPSQGVDHPLAEGPVHLIGHSRGGSLVAELANDLGQKGIWVDQLTTLDPHPTTFFTNDPATIVPWNVVFADNYWQAYALDLGTVPDGTSVDGAHNVHLDSSVLGSGGYYLGIADGGSHADVHLWYQGTIDTSDSASDDKHTVPADWFNAAGMGPRDSIGYDYSRIRGGARPADGLIPAFGGTASRMPISGGLVGAQWPNVGDLHLTTAGNQFQAGQPLATQFSFEDDDSGATVSLYFDTDRNPYGNVYRLASDITYSANGSGIFHPSSDVGLSTSGIPTGQYYLMAQITDGQHTRFAYASIPITITPAPAVGPDLTGVLTGAPGTLPVGGKNNRVTLRINNNGNRTATGNTVIRLYASADTTFDGADILIGTYSQKLNLAGGQSVFSTLTFNSPTNVPDGSYHLLAIIDATSRVSETSEFNNVAVSSGMTTIRQAYVDPKPVSYSFPSTIKRKSKQTATVWVQNAGSVPATGTYTMTLYLAPDTTGVGAIVLGQVKSKLTLTPGKKTPMKITFTVPAGATSGWYLAGLLSFNGTPRDRDTTNNVFYSNGTITVI